MATRKPGDSKKTVTYNDFINGQVEKTRRQVKATEVSAGLVTLLVGVFLFLIAAIVIDHWIVPLRSLGRWGMLGLLLAGVAAFLFLRLLPLTFRRVNPVYAARTIENGSPGMKNTLVNHLMLRDNRKGTSKGVLRAVEKQAAQRLQRSQGETAVDRGRVIRLGYLLLALMAFAAAYKFFSPKDPLATVGRITAPWKDIAPPTRVQIEQVRPGNTTVYADGNPVKVEAVIRGLDRDEPVTLFWSTKDGRVSKQAIDMQSLSSDRRDFQCFLPKQDAGLRQDVRYFITAGDAKSPMFDIQVRTAPTIAVKAVHYDYPRYTRLRPRVQADSGDITAVEGTRVTIHAAANQTIQSASLDINCDGRVTQMRVDGAKASASFVLVAGADNRGRVSQHSYLIRFTNAQGYENPNPVRYAINVIPDRKPQVSFLDLPQKEVKLPINRALPLAVAAEDDYGLRSVELFADRQTAREQQLFSQTPQLLAEETFGPFNNGRKPFLFRPLGDQLRERLKVGDVVRVWAIARDNKRPQANTGTSKQLLVRIVEPDKKTPKTDGGEGGKPKSQDGGTGNKSPMNKQGDPKPDKKQEKKKEKRGGQGGMGSAGGASDAKKKPQEKKEGGGAGGGGLDRDEFNRLAQAAEEKKQNGSGGSTSSQNPGSNGDSGGAKKNSRAKSPPGGGTDSGTGNKSDPTGAGRSPMEKDKKQKGKIDGKRPPEGGFPRGGTDNPNRFPGKTKGAKTDFPTRKKAPSNTGDPKTKRKSITPEKSKNQGTLKSNPDAKPKANPGAKGEGTSTRPAAGEEKPEKIEPKDSKITPKGGNPDDLKGDTTGGRGTDKEDPTPGRLSKTEKVANEKTAKKDSAPPKKNKQEADNPSINENESKGQKGEGGDRNGGGDRGGGQSSGREGTGGSGQASAAEEGTGAAPGQGNGQTSKQRGKQKEANSPTGNPGEKSGRGSTARKGNSSPGESKSRGSGSPKSKGPNSKPGSSADGNNRDPRANGFFDGGRGGKDTRPKFDADNERPRDPDLEAARKAVDLVLEYLKDHPDEAGLSEPQRIKWTQHLQNLRDRAGQEDFDGIIARNQLRSLGGRLSKQYRSDGGFQLFEGDNSGGLDRYPDRDYVGGERGARPKRK